MADDTRTWYLYRLIDAESIVIYVGVSCSPWTRMRTHERDKPWWPEVTEVQMRNLGTIGQVAALTLERQAISELKPRHNVVHNPRLLTPLPPRPYGITRKAWRAHFEAKASA